MTALLCPPARWCTFLGRALGVAAGLILVGSAGWGAGSLPVVKPPFQFQLDATPLDRAAPPPGSYGPVLRRAALSVGHLSVAKRNRAGAGSPAAETPRRSGEGAAGASRGAAVPGGRSGLGSCFLLTADGYVLTTSHGLDGADAIKVRLGSPAREYPATLVGRDSASDLAVLKIDVMGMTPAILGDSDQLQPGDLVLAAGDPTGEGPEFSHGIISALDRSIAGLDAADGVIETDDPLAPGESGGPLLDGRGRVIGVSTTSSNEAAAGLGLAIPINLAREVALQLVASGRVQRGFLGVTLQELTDDLRNQFGASEGVLVAEVAPEGPASHGGLKGGDVIVQANGAAVADARHLQRAVNRLAPGREVALEVLRNGRREVLHVKLGVRPGPADGNGGEESAATDDGVLDGVTVADLTAEVRDALHLPVGLTGAVITEVAPTSASAAAGLRPGDVITELDRQPVATADEAVHLSAIIKGPKVMVRLWRGGGSHYVVVDESAR